MIFLTLGTEKFPFDRLLIEFDRIRDHFEDRIIAQSSTYRYQPKGNGYEFYTMMPYSQFLQCMENADLIISHGGIGSIITALRHEKRLLVAPRYKALGEHIDDHQVMCARRFEELGLVNVFYKDDNLLEKILATQRARPPGHNHREGPPPLVREVWRILTD